MVLAVAMVLGVSGCGKQQKAVATINGESLSEETYRAYLFSVKMEIEQGFGPGIWEMEMEGETMENMAKERALESAVAMVVTSQKAKEMKLKLTAEEKEEAKSIAANFVQQLKEPLAEEGITEDTMRIMMEGIIMSQKVLEDLADKFTPSQDAEEFEKFVEENKTYFESVTAQHVLLSIKDETGNLLPEDKQEAAEKLAAEILDKALAGEDMGELAKEYSEDPGSKDEGGEYTFPRGQMVPEFEEAAFNGEEGKVYPEVVVTDHGYHIIKTVEKIIASEEEMKGSFEEYQKAEYVNGEIDEWIKGAKVEKTELYDTIIIQKPEQQEPEQAEQDAEQETEEETEEVKEEVK